MVVDGSELVFWTRMPAQLVQASLSGGEERVVADYADATKRSVTAMALDAMVIWFTSVMANGASLSGGTIHRTPRSGGPAVDVVSLPDGVAANGILFDGNFIHMSTANAGLGLGGAGEFLARVQQGGGHRGLSLAHAEGRRLLPRRLRRTFFCWAESKGADTCDGTFKRRNKDGSPEQTLLTSLDRVVRLRTRSGAFYPGSASQPFRKPATPGQLVEWKP